LVKDLKIDSLITNPCNTDFALLSSQSQKLLFFKLYQESPYLTFNFKNQISNGVFVNIKKDTFTSEFFCIVSEKSFLYTIYLKDQSVKDPIKIDQQVNSILHISDYFYGGINDLVAIATINGVYIKNIFSGVTIHKLINIIDENNFLSVEYLLRYKNKNDWILFGNEELRIWSVETGKCVKSFPSLSGMKSTQIFHYSSYFYKGENDFLLVIGNNKLYAWRISENRCINVFDMSGITYIQCLPNIHNQLFYIRRNILNSAKLDLFDFERYFNIHEFKNVHKIEDSEIFGIINEGDKRFHLLSSDYTGFTIFTSY
jgi:hypothetical protein